MISHCNSGLMGSRVQLSFRRSSSKLFYEVVCADMEAPRVPIVRKPSCNRDRWTSFLRIRLSWKSRPARNQNKHSVARVPSVIFPGVHFHQFPHLNRNKVFVVATIIQLTLALAIEECHDDMKPLEIISRNISVELKWLAISRFHLLSCFPEPCVSTWKKHYRGQAD